MSRTWLQREGPKWVQDGIVSEEQFIDILDRYPVKDRRTQLLPLLAMILIGVSILSALASNWGDIPHLLRLGILIIILVSFYIAGELRTSRGYPHTGAALSGIGVISFGAGIALLGDMYHLIATDARLFILWGLSALGTLLLYRHPVFFFLSGAIFLSGQFYSVTSFDSFNWLIALLFVVTLVPYAHYRSPLYARFVGAGVILQVVMGFTISDIPFLWSIPVIAGLYTFTDLVLSDTWRRPIHVSSLVVTLYVSFYWFNIAPQDASDMLVYPLPNWKWFVPVLLLLFSLSLWTKWQQKKMIHAFDWVLFLPWFQLTQLSSKMVHTTVYLLMLYIFVTYVLLQGFKSGQTRMANTGIFLFLITTVNAYFNFAWDFLPKSLFFLLGGLLLFALNSLLQRQKKASLTGGGKEK
ncbi:Uncharacterized membrane protein [Marininema mesophilum]|uniref:Uncharacterized membrane protein n=1 Tax=Marininema mesophilum TaxID=1048340 RepID=A0A1H2ZXG7_9BACL|nr:DUF2157 domain-containing protein [Marininema mesophilum]SDX21608.1 Uncharacterized membrane protein [Marininema mesophilum]